MDKKPHVQACILNTEFPPNRCLPSDTTCYCRQSTPSFAEYTGSGERNIHTAGHDTPFWWSLLHGMYCLLSLTPPIHTCLVKLQYLTHTNVQPYPREWWETSVRNVSKEVRIFCSVFQVIHGLPGSGFQNWDSIHILVLCDRLPE